VRHVNRLVAVLAVVTLVGTVWWLVGRSRAGREVYPVPGEGKERVTVEVLNASGVDGLARAATMRLRARGIDVVFYGNAPIDTLQLTRVVTRQGDSTAAQRVRDALEVGQIADEPEARLLLSVSVYLGRDAALTLGFRP
jgi:hypothetical protein